MRTAETASSLAETHFGSDAANSRTRLASAFTTGSADGGYLLSSVSVYIFGINGEPGDLTVTVRANGAGDWPGAVVATLSGANPAAAGTHTFACTSSCALDSDTTYHLMLTADSAPNDADYLWSKTSSANEAVAPAGSGWSIGDNATYSTAISAWGSSDGYYRFKVAAVKRPVLTATAVTESAATLNIADHTGGAWWYQRTAPAGSNACTAVAEGTATASLSQLTGHASYTYKAYDQTGCATADEIAAATFTATDDALTASKIANTTATVTLTGHTGNWYLKRTAPTGNNTCKTKSDYTEDLTGLTANTAYTYKAYDTAGCADADEIAAATFTTLGPVTVTNRDQTSNHTLNVGNLGFIGEWKIATAFTTGPNGGGYTLTSATVDLGDTTGAPTGLTAYIYTNSTSDRPDTEVKNLGTKTPADNTSPTWECTDCNLNPNTTYHLVLEGSYTTGVQGFYKWKATSSDNQTNTPANAEWEIANETSRHASGNWSSFGTNAGQFSITATVKPTLEATNITGTAATLTLTRHLTAWYYKHTTGNCTAVTAGTETVHLTTLTANTTYTYTAYSDSTCTTQLATTTFKTATS